ncbi:MAG TPA: sigma-70 family RNA polymerase sigma factor [Solirubrobacteraceae bacterium]|nr:sigma-70 family RNA polymerase sigma factor [Solirubrobacteraceae bacterium]
MTSRPGKVTRIPARSRLVRSQGPGGLATEPLIALDSDSRWWLERLRAEGQPREEAIARLHRLMVRAARFEVARRRASLAQLGSAELDDLAMQSADDALLLVLAKLDQFRGTSLFTTWAYKVALVEVAVTVRRRTWQGRELPVEPEAWLAQTDGAWSVELEVEQRELLAALRHAIRTELTAHQREVLVAVVIGGVPIDVLAERLATSRGALYKTIHDARQTLRRRLAADGLDPKVPTAA